MFNSLLENIVTSGLKLADKLVIKSRKVGMLNTFRNLCVLSNLPICNAIGFSDELCYMNAKGRVYLMGFTSFDYESVTFNLKRIQECDAGKDARIKDIYEYVARHEFRHWQQMHCLPKELYTNAYAVAALEQDAEAFGIGIVQDMAIVESNIKMAIGAAIA